MAHLTVSSPINSMSRRESCYGIYDEWKNKLIKAGLLEPDEEINQIDLMQRWQGYQSPKIKQQLSSITKEFLPEKEEGLKTKKKLNLLNHKRTSWKN